MAKNPKTGPKPGRVAKGKGKGAAKVKDAAKPAQTAAAGGEGGGARTLVMITEKNLNGLLKTANSLNKQTAQIVGTLREKIAYAQEKQHLDTKAFALLRKFDKMEAEAAARLWDTLNMYMDMSGVMKKIQAVGEFDFKTPDGKDIETETEESGEAGEGEGAPAGEKSGDKVVQLRGGESATAH